MRRLTPPVAVLLVAAAAVAVAAPAPAIITANSRAPSVSVTLPEVQTVGIPFAAKLALQYGLQGPAQGTGPLASQLYYRVKDGASVVKGGSIDAADKAGYLVQTAEIGGLKLARSGAYPLTFQFSYNPVFPSGPGTSEAAASAWAVSGGLTVVPFVVTIALAIITQEVMTSLLVGIFLVALILNKYNVYIAYKRMLDDFLVKSIADEDHAYIFLFVWFLAALSALVQRSGGAFGMATIFNKFARNARWCGLIAILFGWCIFFSDTANILLTATTMRPITDSFMVSREKLAFIVDANSVSIPSIAPISSWIGFEISMIAQEIDKLIAAGADLTNYDTSPFIIFLQTIPSRFYPLYMMFVSLLTALLQREFGPMLRAERRSRHEGKLVSDAANVAEVRLDADLEPQPHTPKAWWNAAIPIAVVVALVVGGMVDTGLDKSNAKGVPKTVINIFSNASSFKALVWGSFTATVITAILYWLQYEKGGKIVFGPLYWFRRRSGARPLLWLGESLTTIILGIKGQTAPIIILILAWALSAGIGRLGTGRFIASALAAGMDPRGLPSLVFLLASVLSFAIGSSWGTMALLFPIAVPAAYYGAPGNASLLNTTISAILAGAVFGDQCSPLSDTTILSAAASKCDLRHHIYTQLPYALVVAALAVLLGYLPVGFGAYPAWAGILIGLAAIFLFLFLICKSVADPNGPEDFILSACHRAKVFSLDTVDKARARLVGGANDGAGKDAAGGGAGGRDDVIVVDEDVNGPLDWWSRFTADRRRSSFLGRNDLVVVGHRAGSEINLSPGSPGPGAVPAGSPEGLRYRSRSAVGEALPHLPPARGGAVAGHASVTDGKAASGDRAV